MAKREKVLNTTIDTEKMIVTFEVIGSKQPNIVVNANKLPDEMRNLLTLAGIVKKVGDSAAMSCDPETGKPASPADKHAALKATFDALTAGQWNRRGDGSGGRVGLLARAIAEYKKISIDDAREKLEEMPKAQQTALRRHPPIARLIDKYRGPSDVNVDDVLSTF